MSLNDKATLVKVEVSTWSGRRFDSDASNEFNTSKGAEKDVARVNKLLVPKHELEPCWKAGTAIRNYFNTMTLPWMKGVGMLPNSKYFDFNAGLRPLIGELEHQADVLDRKYKKIVEMAPARSGGLFKHEDYPEEIRSKFGVQVDWFPLPNAGDFRIDLTQTELDEIENRWQEKFADAAKDLVKRMADPVARMIERLKVYDQDNPKKNPFRDTVISNIEELLDTVPALNIMDDPEITKMINGLKKLVVVDADQLRKSPEARKAVVSDADKILNKMKGYLQ